MRDLPVNLSGYRLMVSEAPVVKTRQDDKGEDVIVTDRVSGDPHYVVSLFAKPREAGPSGRRARGEEIKVTLLQAPDGGIDEGDFVELIAPVVNAYEIRDGDRFSSGLSFKANALSPIGS